MNWGTQFPNEGTKKNKKYIEILARPITLMSAGDHQQIHSFCLSVVGCFSRDPPRVPSQRCKSTQKYVWNMSRTCLGNSYRIFSIFDDTSVAGCHFQCLLGTKHRWNAQLKSQSQVVGTGINPHRDRPESAQRAGALNGADRC